MTLRTITLNIPSQKIITKENVLIDIAAVAYYHIVDPQKSVIAIENVDSAINQISQTTVRNVVGQFSLDQLLSQTLDINAKMSVEKNSTIMLPAQFMTTVQEAMKMICGDSQS